MYRTQHRIDVWSAQTNRISKKSDKRQKPIQKKLRFKTFSVSAVSDDIHLNCIQFSQLQF